MTPDDVQAKERYIKDYFDALDLRIRFTSELKAGGHRHEAMLLCCCYIEGIANHLARNSDSSAKNFCEALTQYGGEPVFQLVFPQRALEHFPWKSASPALGSSLRAALESLPSQEAFTLEEVVRRLQSSIAAEAIGFLRSEGWRATAAFVVYERIRSRLVHWLSSADYFTFPTTLHQGARIPDIGFQMLHDALSSIASHVRRESLASGEWFGRA